MRSRLVIVSNRVPVGASPTALEEISAVADVALEEDDNLLWFGWSGRLCDQGDKAGVAIAPGPRPGVSFATIDLTASESEGYLDGFANGTLWPLFHGIDDRVRFHADHLAAYHLVNRRFAARLAAVLVPGDRVWVHDYHLTAVGTTLRGLGVAAPLGLFLHAPFPPAARLLAWSWHRKLAADLAAYDLVGFQTARDRANFEDFMRRAGQVATSRSRAQRTEIFPAGIRTRAFMALAASPDVVERSRRLSLHLRDRRLIMGAGRLDYAKGAIERLHAYEHLLERAPQYRGTTSMVQVTAPSRLLVPGYLEHRMSQQALAERINTRFLTFGWMPVLDIYARLPRRSLAALYRLSRVGLATPLRDGMTLVAKEFVAAQDAHDPGVLILSRFSGAADLLTEALPVDPSNAAQLARAIRTALEMPVDERRDRWRRMIVKLLHHDAQSWHHSLVYALSRAADAAQPLAVAPDKRPAGQPAARGVGRPRRPHDTAVSPAAAARQRKARVELPRVAPP